MLACFLTNRGPAPIKGLLKVHPDFGKDPVCLGKLNEDTNLMMDFEKYTCKATVFMRTDSSVVSKYCLM